MASSAISRPFDEGVNSVKVRADAPNPFIEGSVEFRNFELGRSFALQRMKGSQLYPLQKPA